jgi:phage baseplate assembly protein W
MALQKEFLGVGWGFPIALDPDTGQTAMVAAETDIEQAILIILSTAPGERAMRPDFGCGAHELVFAALDTATFTRVQAAVTDALTKYEPRIKLLAVTVDPTQAADGLLLISVDYVVRTTNQSGNMVYPFYFREGGGGS